MSAIWQGRKVKVFFENIGTIEGRITSEPVATGGSWEIFGDFIAGGWRKGEDHLIRVMHFSVMELIEFLPEEIKP